MSLQEFSESIIYTLFLLRNTADSDSLGILNVFACLPQFVGSFISFVVFSILEPGLSPEFTEGDVGPPRVGINAIAVCMGIGGISTLVAAHYTLRFKHR